MKKISPILKFDIAVVGGGPAGMAAALAAEKKGCTVVMLERDSKLGGILNQCIHNGFGLHYFGEELTGPEYADRFVKRIEASSVKVMSEAMVLSVTEKRVITALSPKEGLVTIEAGAIVLAMGCRERTAGAIQLAGSRPAGIYTAGMAQRIINLEGYLAGKKAVILGSGDIGLIMARRMTFEGAEVKLVLELMPFSSGLKRNIVQCLDDYDIPLLYGHTVTRVVGKTRLEGLYYAEVDENLKPKLETEKFVECDTLLLSVGLIPENDLVADLPMDMSRITSGAVADEYRQTSIEGIFSAGNVLHVHDLVDNVSFEAEIAGSAAADFVHKKLKKGREVKALGGQGVRYVMPAKVYEGDGKVKLFFRVDNIYKGKKLVAESGGEVLHSQRHLILAPGEMGEVEIDKTKINGDIVLRLE